MESLILNGKCCGEVNYTEHFIKTIFSTYSKCVDNSKLYAIEVLLNALNVDLCSGNVAVYEILRQNMDMFINDMAEIKKRFSRVHDKKIGLLFCANIMRTKDSFQLLNFP